MTQRIVIIGGGPAGYEAALVGAQYGAEVTVIDSEIGGGCVLYDCVPSKAFIATSSIRTNMRRAEEMGMEARFDPANFRLSHVNGRVKSLAQAQSADIRAQLQREGVKLLSGRGRLAENIGAHARQKVEVTLDSGKELKLEADVVLLATGASPRVLPSAKPDGDRILTWRQIYDLTELPEHLIVVGSGVTGAEFVSAFTEMGVRVTMVSSRDRVLPHEDADAALVLEEVLSERGVSLIKHAYCDSVTRTDTGVTVRMSDGREVSGSHALMTVGSVPNTDGLGLEKVGIEVNSRGHIPVDRVSRTGVTGIYAAGDCTDLFPLASVAAMQGRIAMYHALGEGVNPIKLKTVAAAVFTRPEIATVGISHAQIEAGEVPARVEVFPLASNPRAKMSSLRRGFVKVFCRPASGVVIGGVVVAPTASELILPLSIAVRNQLTVEDVAGSFSVYPSLSGSISEASRHLMSHDDLD